MTSWKFAIARVREIFFLFLLERLSTNGETQVVADFVGDGDIFPLTPSCSSSENMHRSRYTVSLSLVCGSLKCWRVVVLEQSFDVARQDAQSTAAYSQQLFVDDPGQLILTSSPVQHSSCVFWSLLVAFRTYFKPFTKGCKWGTWVSCWRSTCVDVRKNVLQSRFPDLCSF